MPLRTDLKVGDPHTAAHNEERAFANGLETRAKNIEDAASSLTTRVSNTESMASKHASRHAFGGGDMLTPDDIRALALRSTIANDRDLNTVVDSGIYWQGSSGATTTDLNYPFNGFAGLIEVYALGATFIVQRTTYFTELSNNRGTWTRTKYSTGAWSPWRNMAVDDVRLLTSGENLDNFREPGQWVVTTTGNQGLPIAATGLLEISTQFGKGYNLQRYTTFSGTIPTRVFNRLAFSGAFGPWRELAQADQVVSIYSESKTAPGEDANTFTTPGKFLLSSSALNTPGPMNGHLEVIDRSASDQLVQRFTSSSGATAGEQWNRYKGNSSLQWQPWKKLFVESDLGNKIIHGTGDPRGVVSASQTGTIYVDRSATNGARAWFAGTVGSGGWTPSDADTGYRNVSDLLDPAWVLASAAPKFTLRRRGDLVMLDARISPAAATIGQNRALNWIIIQTLPTGWVPSAYDVDIFTSYASVGPVTHRVQNLSTATQIRLVQAGATGTWASGDTMAFSIVWSTAHAWPNSLPGTPG